MRPTWLPEKKIIVPIIMYGPKSDSSEFVKGVPHLDDLLKPGTMNHKMFTVLNTNLRVGQGFLPPAWGAKKLSWTS